MSRYANLRGAASGKELRHASFQGRDHIVVPVVALVEGVLQAMNADGPELVLASEFSKTPQGWNGRPVVPNHPAVGDDRVSANSPSILEANEVGRVFNTRVAGKKLLMDAWLDPDLVTKLESDLLERLNSGKTVEVSVGVFVTAEEKKGKYNGDAYDRVWRDIIPDHLAMLPEGMPGACNIEDGCGAPRRVAKRRELRAASGCGCGKPNCKPSSTKEAVVEKCERVKALMAKKDSPFKPEDEDVLMEMSEDGLKALEAEPKVVEKIVEKIVEKPVPAVAPVAAATPEPKPEPKKPLTEEEYLAEAPDSIKTIVSEHKAAAAKRHLGLVKQIKTLAKDVYTDDELTAMPADQLDKVLKVAAASAPKKDFSGGAPRAASAEEEDNTPPAPIDMNERLRLLNVKAS